MAILLDEVPTTSPSNRRSPSSNANRPGARTGCRCPSTSRPGTAGRGPEPPGYATGPCWAGYLLAACWAMGHLLVDPNGRILAGNPNDQAFFEFVTAHGARVLAHGANPFFTGQIGAPPGVNLMANTSILGLRCRWPR